VRAFALFEPGFAREEPIAFFRQGRGRCFELLEHQTIVDGTIDVGTGDDGDSGDESCK
jgi:hypothetical protein